MSSAWCTLKLFIVAKIAPYPGMSYSGRNKFEVSEPCEFDRSYPIVCVFVLIETADMGTLGPRSFVRKTFAPFHKPTKYIAKLCSPSSAGVRVNKVLFLIRFLRNVFFFRVRQKCYYLFCRLIYAHS